MNTRTRIVLVVALVLLAGASLWAIVLAAPGMAPLAGGAPEVVAYQGEVQVDGSPYTGDGYFKFAVVSASGGTTYWSNDGTSSGGGEPSAAVQLAVGDGLFSVLLGDISLGGMTQPLAAGVFREPDRYLRVWFSASAGGPFDQLAPDTRIAAVPYALQAASVASFPNMVTVAKSGADFASIQAAIDSITDAESSNPYLVWVGPGIYEEQVTMKPYVHLQGSDQAVTLITSTATSGDWPPSQATLQLDAFVSVRDLTVQSGGAGDNNVAILAPDGATHTTVAEVMAYAGGPAVNNYAIAVTGDSDVLLQHVTAFGAWASGHNIGLLAHGGARVSLHGGSFTARAGDNSWAAFITNSGTTLEAVDATMHAEGANVNNTALYPYDGAEVVLRGGDYTARGGEQTNAIADQLNSTVAAYDVTALAEDGITNYGLGPFDGSSMIVRGATVTARGGTTNYAVCSESFATLDGESVISLAENGSDTNYGLYVSGDGARATVRGGSFTGRGGTEARGIWTQLGGASLDAEGVTALGEDGGDANYGLAIFNGAAATLRGGSFTARGGNNAWGIVDTDASTTLVAEGITAVAVGASIDTCGLYSDNGATALLHGGSFTGQGGTWAKGIYHTGTGTELEAENITALGSGGSSENFGLLVDNYDTVTTLRGGSFTGRGGTFAYGIDNQFSGPMLEAEDVTVLGTEGSEANYGLRNAEGAHARLRGGSISAQWGITSCAIFNVDIDTWLEADSVNALAENGSDFNYGLDNLNGAGASLSGGSFTARWGEDSFGIHNTGISTTLQADNVTARGELGNDWNFGLCNTSAAWAGLHGGTFLASGGGNAPAIYNSDSGTWLETDNVTALADNSFNNYGLHNFDGAAARLRDGSFVAQGGNAARGILNYGSGTTLGAEGVNALAEHGSDTNYGFDNGGYAEATLRSGTFTGREGADARGISSLTTATLEAESVTALGENGSDYSMGLDNNGTAVLRGGAFTGHGGGIAWGVLNAGSGGKLKADSITALGKEGYITNYGLHNYNDATADLSQAVLEGANNGLYLESGTVHLAVSELDGGATRLGATLTCYQVYDGNYAAYTCP